MATTPKTSAQKVDEITSEIDPELAKAILETKEAEEANDRDKTRTVRVTNDVWDVIASHGKFGETISDVLRRMFDKYGIELKKD